MQSMAWVEALLATHLEERERQLSTLHSKSDHLLSEATRLHMERNDTCGDADSLREERSQL